MQIDVAFALRQLSVDIPPIAKKLSIPVTSPEELTEIRDILNRTAESVQEIRDYLVQ